LSTLEEVPRSVQNLYLSCNRITNLTTFSHLKEVVILDISYNELSDISCLSSLSNLRDLNVSHNSIVDITPILRNQKLQSVDLRNNQIRKLDFRFSILPQLHTVFVSGNRIQQIHHLYHLKQLKELYLEENYLCSFSVLKPMKHLQHLNLNDNQIEMLDVRNFPNLQYLHLDRNCIVEFIGLDTLRELRVLTMESQPDSM
jgi:internalin A